MRIIQRKEVTLMTYEAPEVFTLGEAKDLIMGSALTNYDCCTCGHKGSAGGADEYDDLD
jgi:hypothetical protein